MKRRNFLKGVLPFTATPLLLNGIPLNILATTHLTTALSCADISDRVLVLIQLAGGNDGLNTLIPVNDYATYKNYRPNLAIPDSGARAFSNLDTSLPIAQQVGIQPDMMAFKDLYEQGKVNFVQDVTYPNNNKSHFKGTDILLSGSDSDSANTNSGWFGNYLNARFPNFPDDYPTQEMPDPLGIQLGDRMVSLGFQRKSGSPVGMVLQGDPSGFFNLISGLGGLLPNVIPDSDYGRELQFLAESQSNTSVYGQRLEQVYNWGTNMVSYPENHYLTNKYNPLSPQLRVVARLLNGGIKTKIFLLRLNGFDHHSNMVSGGDPSSGNHAELLNFLSEGLKAFQSDLKAMGLEDRVMTCTFSEFGRTVGQNGARGTDHGTSAPMMIIGKGVNPGVTGNTPDFSSVSQNNFSAFQYDYRQVMATLLQDWLGAGTPNMNKANLGDFETQKLDLINTNYRDPISGDVIDFVAGPTCYDSETVFPVELLSFTAEVAGQSKVACKWATASERNNEAFIVERSKDGLIFEAKGEIPGNGNSSVVQEYTWTDELPFRGESFYRLKQLDFDGGFTYSDTQKVRIAIDAEIPVDVVFYPNPVVDVLNVSINSAELVEQKVNVRLLKMNGATVFASTISIGNGKQVMQVPVQNLSKGIYFSEVLITKDGYEKRIAWEKIILQ